MTEVSVQRSGVSKSERGRAAMSKRIFCFVLGAMLFGLCQSADAQQPKKVQVIGYLSPTDAATDSPRAEGIRLALRELGYINGQNIAIEYRYSEGKVDRAPELCGGAGASQGRCYRGSWRDAV